MSSNLLLGAIEDAASDNYTHEAVLANLAGTRNVDTIYGSFSSDENGDAEYIPVLGVVFGDNIDQLQ
ncbi:MAG: hypothetical protein OXD43_03895 [Bacteroidetes bacterium]|nr:hypothetical protein [Bacteroidota bacterium]